MSARNQCVRVGEVVSKKSIEFGVPQRSVLGPTLFLVYISDMIVAIQGKEEVFCYTDDTAIICQGTTLEKTYKATEKGLTHVADWLTLNLNKTYYLLVFQKTRISQLLTSYLKFYMCAILHVCSQASASCNFYTIACTNIKYLGVTIDEIFLYNNHITNLTSKIRKITYVFKSVRHSAPENLILHVYKDTLVNPFFVNSLGRSP